MLFNFRALDDFGMIDDGFGNGIQIGMDQGSGVATTILKWVARLFQLIIVFVLLVTELGKWGSKCYRTTRLEYSIMQIYSK